MRGMPVIQGVKKVLAMIESVEAPFIRWCAAFLGILFVRFLLETFSSPTPSFPATPEVASLIHYVLFFIGAFLSLALVIRIFVPDIARISKFLIFGFPIVWLAPILDLVYSNGAGATMTYAFASNTADLWYAFFHFGAIGTLGGITAGLRTEIIAIFIGAGLYVAIKTGGWGKAVLAALFSYCALFLWGIAPNLLSLAATGVAFPDPGIFSSLISSFASSHLLQNFVRPSYGLSPTLAVETIFNLGMSSALYLVDFALAIVWVAAYRGALLRGLARCLRLGRIAYYYSLLAMGAFVAMRAGTPAPFANWVDALSFACLALAYLSAFGFATGVNDIADVHIDRLNGVSRPLLTGAVTEGDLAQSNWFFLAWALIGGFLAGYWAFFTIIAGTAAYYIYSAPPLRFKRVPIIAPFLVAIAGLSTTMAGFFFVDERKLVVDFPLQLLLLILVCLTLAQNFKDLKDIEGDRAHSIWTIPVLFGERLGKPVVGALLAAAFLAVPVILHDTALFAPSLAAAVLGYLFVVARPYREWPIFLLYFAYAGTVGWLLVR